MHTSGNLEIQWQGCQFDPRRCVVEALGLLSGLLDHCWLGVVVGKSWIISGDWFLMCVLHCSCGEVSLHLGNNTRYHHWRLRRAVDGIRKSPLVHC